MTDLADAALDVLHACRSTELCSFWYFDPVASERSSTSPPAGSAAFGCCAGERRPISEQCGSRGCPRQPCSSTPRCRSSASDQPGRSGMLPSGAAVACSSAGPNRTVPELSVRRPEAVRELTQSDAPGPDRPASRRHDRGLHHEHRPARSCAGSGCWPCTPCSGSRPASHASRSMPPGNQPESRSQVMPASASSARRGSMVGSTVGVGRELEGVGLRHDRQHRLQRLHRLGVQLEVVVAPVEQVLNSADWFGVCGLVACVRSRHPSAPIASHRRTRPRCARSVQTNGGVGDASLDRHRHATAVDGEPVAEHLRAGSSARRQADR